MSHQQARTQLPAARAAVANASDSLSQAVAAQASVSARDPSTRHMQSPVSESRMPSASTSQLGSSQLSGVRSSVRGNQFQMLHKHVERPHRYGIQTTSNGDAHRSHPALTQPRVNAMFGSAFDKGVGAVVGSGVCG